jgi:hypothetical protein
MTPTRVACSGRKPGRRVVAAGHGNRHLAKRGFFRTSMRMKEIG